MNEKEFSFLHIYFGDTTGPEVFKESELPEWITRKGFKWWLDGYVLKLGVGDSISSDFHEIKRIK